MKKCLSVLPYIGDDEDENGEGDFEVYIHVPSTTFMLLSAWCIKGIVDIHVYK